MADTPPPSLIVYRGRRIDVGDFLDRHPGGRAILERFLGQDATCVMHMMHDMRTKQAQKLLERMDRGPAQDQPLSAFDADYLALEASFYEQGLFEPSRAWYAYKAACVIALFAAALWVSTPWLSGLLFGLFIQQSAFIAHDVCHDAAVPRRQRNFVAWLFGTVFFGLRDDKWTRDHTTHHAITNRPLGDPQMNLLPHLVYQAREIPAFEERKKRTITDWERTKMGYQHLWLMPLLLLYGRINIVRVDFMLAWRERHRRYLLGYALHFTLWGIMLAKFAYAPLGTWPAFVLSTLAISGVIHLQLILSHAYAPRLFEAEQAEAGMRLQAISNQNITTTFLDDWFHGGLQHHIEHHLFPRLPRHSLPKVRLAVRALCEKHSLPYRSDYFPVAVWDLMKSLYAQGAPLRAQLAARQKRVAG
jgi:fatty acid desaturase